MFDSTCIYRKEQDYSKYQVHNVRNTQGFLGKFSTPEKSRIYQVGNRLEHTILHSERWITNREKLSELKEIILHSGWQCQIAGLGRLGFSLLYMKRKNLI